MQIQQRKLTVHFVSPVLYNISPFFATNIIITLTPKASSRLTYLSKCMPLTHTSFSTPRFKPNSASLSVFTHGGWLVCVLCVINCMWPVTPCVWASMWQTNNRKDSNLSAIIIPRVASSDGSTRVNEISNWIQLLSAAKSIQPSVWLRDSERGRISNR